MGESWILNFDGACEPINPRGIATFGFVLKNAGAVAREGKGLAAPPGSDQATNNVAEYAGLIRGLDALKELTAPGDQIEILGDSQLVIRQVEGQYAVNAEHLKPLYQKAAVVIHDLRMNGRKITLRWIERELNGEADKLSKLAVEEVMKGDPEVLKKITLKHGKHAGKTLSEVPKSYIDWLSNARNR